MLAVLAGMKVDGGEAAPAGGAPATTAPATDAMAKETVSQAATNRRRV